MFHLKQFQKSLGVQFFDRERCCFHKKGHPWKNKLFLSESTLAGAAAAVCLWWSNQILHFCPKDRRRVFWAAVWVRLVVDSRRLSVSR